MSTPPPRLRPDDAALLVPLRSLHLHPRVVTERLCDELDVRLEVRDPTRPGRVELLCRDAHEPPPPTWDAVRVPDGDAGDDAGGDRVVWRGPDRCCPVGAVLAFLSDLVRCDEAVLRDRYRALG